METSNGVGNKKSFEIPVPIAIIIAGAMLSGAWMYNNWINLPGTQQKRVLAAEQKSQQQKAELEEKILPSRGVELPATWGNLGEQLISAGVIDEKKFRDLYQEQLTEEQERMLAGNSTGKIRITEDNASFVLNMLWGLGLSNANPILTDPKEMNNSKYGGASRFASTGGWTVALGSAMDHYNRHIFFKLTPEQQALVDKVSRGIYRPCCGNSTHFPDCNHGMAMLGLLELMASQGASEEEMWKAALAVNSYWFPDTYLTIAAYMKDKKGIEWKDVNPQEILGADYSSAQGYAKIAAQAATASGGRSGGGCSIAPSGAETSAQTQRKQSGCGL